MLRAFTNSWVRQRLHQMGLTPATAFACLFDLLFRPTPAALDLYADVLQVGHPDACLCQSTQS